MSFKEVIEDINEDTCDFDVMCFVNLLNDKGLDTDNVSHLEINAYMNDGRLMRINLGNLPEYEDSQEILNELVHSQNIKDDLASD